MKLSPVSHIENQKGQASVEYLLMLFITLVVGGGLMYQFHAGFGQYIDDYFGGYIACLLETGELPALGGSVASGQCNAPKFEFTTVAKGSKGGAGGKGAKGAGTDAADKDKKSKEDDKEKTASAQSSPTLGGSKNSESGGGGRSSSSFANKSFGGSKDRPKKIEVKSKEGGFTIGDDSMQAGQGSGNNRNNRMRSKKVNTKVISLASLKQKEEEKRRPSKKEVKVTEEKSRVAKMKYIPKTRTIASMSSEDTKFTVGGFLKWFIIILLLLAVVIFVGSQVLSYAKSKDS